MWSHPSVWWCRAWRRNARTGDRGSGGQQGRPGGRAAAVAGARIGCIFGKDVQGHPFKSTRKDPRAAFWPTFTAACPLGTAAAGVAVDDPVTGTAGALVAGAAIGVADPQAETINARTVSERLVFTRISSDQVFRHASAQVNGMVLGI